MLTEQELLERWENLTFTDDFIFSHVMHDREICRQVVELILGVRIGEIRYLSAQDELKTDPDSMRVVMDVFLRDEDKIINVEMQTGHKRELPRRSRYYQSVADVSTTPTGAKYRQLPDNIVIFICTFDPFDRNLPRYTFEFTCQESGHWLKLGDGSLRIFLNTGARELDGLDQKLQTFYHYIQKGMVESELAEAISGRITTLKNDSIARRHYMTLALKMADARYDGFEEGLEQGAYQTKLETARKLLTEGLATEMVARCTDLPLDVVQGLAEN